MTKLNQTYFHPYGTGADTRSAPIIATGEMWGNHCEKWYSERHYGNGSPVSASFFSRLQGSTFSNNTFENINANFWAIESFNPNLSSDKWRWIPRGLPYDLWDNRDDGGFPVADAVYGFTINQSFNALQSDVRSIPAFKERLLQQNGNLQFLQVNSLFNAYSY